MAPRLLPLVLLEPIGPFTLQAQTVLLSQQVCFIHPFPSECSVIFTIKPVLHVPDIIPCTVNATSCCFYFEVFVLRQFKVSLPSLYFIPITFISHSVALLFI